MLNNIDMVIFNSLQNKYAGSTHVVVNRNAKLYVYIYYIFSVLNFGTKYGQVRHCATGSVEVLESAWSSSGCLVSSTT